MKNPFLSKSIPLSLPLVAALVALLASCATDHVTDNITVIRSDSVFRTDPCCRCDLKAVPSENGYLTLQGTITCKKPLKIHYQYNRYVLFSAFDLYYVCQWLDENREVVDEYFPPVFTRKSIRVGQSIQIQATAPRKKCKAVNVVLYYGIRNEAGFLKELKDVYH